MIERLVKKSLLLSGIFIWKTAQLITAMALSLSLTLAAGTATAGEGGQPNGQPFLAMQQQITDLETYLSEEFAAVWTRVGELQAAIDSNNARDDAQDQLIALLGGALAELEARVAANEGAIEALEAQDAVLGALITALQGRADDLQAQINAQGDRIDLLVLADQALQQLIDALAARVTLLESGMSTATADIGQLKQQMAAAQSAIATKQDRVYQYCGAGSSIRKIHSNGSVDCETDSVATGGFTSFYVDKYSASDNANNTAIWNWTSVTATCPSGSKRTGGGFWLSGDLPTASDSYPTGSNSWKVTIAGTMPISYTYKSYVVCLSLY
ncbi:MAG: hypothetical protein IMF07_00885 [Proteobacteria bacterium]|nr:hypothetical protein [Pseudomonadota bacterium]